MDDQETKERTEALQAYAGETPEHFVRWVDDCVKASMKATEEIRNIWDKCWEAYNSRVNFKNKEGWQSKAVTNEPYITVQQAKAVVRRALMRPDAINITGVEKNDMDLSDAVQKSFDFWLNPNHADFSSYFADATDIALAIGQSMEVIPTWDEEKGLKFELVEPWKIHRDPDSISRNPHSGMYWIHEEWMDKWKLKEAGYKNIDETGEEPDLEQKKQEQRKGMLAERGEFRKFMRVREFWGTVLDKKGNLLLPNATFTVGGNKIIKEPVPGEYIVAKFPGVGFSPLVNPTRFYGKGLIEGVIALWWLMINLMNLDIDNLNWVVNKMAAADPSKLLDPSDWGQEPGKTFIVQPGQIEAFYKELTTSANTSDVLTRLQHWRQMYENGCMVNQFVAGLPGNRSDITLGEVEIKTKQSLGVFDSIGMDIEFGAVHVLWLVYEILMRNWTELSTPSITRVLGKDDESAVMFASMDTAQRMELLKSNCDITVSGVSTELQQSATLEKLNIMLGLADKPAYAPYIKPFEMLEYVSGVSGMKKPPFLLTEDEVKDMTMMKASDLYNMLTPEQQVYFNSFIAQAMPFITKAKKQLTGGM